jgi:hypothetical protein
MNIPIEQISSIAVQEDDSTIITLKNKVTLVLGAGEDLVMKADSIDLEVVKK